MRHVILPVIPVNCDMIVIVNLDCESDNIFTVHYLWMSQLLLTVNNSHLYHASFEFRSSCIMCVMYSQVNHIYEICIYFLSYEIIYSLHYLFLTSMSNAGQCTSGYSLISAQVNFYLYLPGLFFYRWLICYLYKQKWKILSILIPVIYNMW